MGPLTPGPEDAKQQDNGAGDLASTTHSQQTIRPNRRPRDVNLDVHSPLVDLKGDLRPKLRS
jgi:hypothetical protein